MFDHNDEFRLISGTRLCLGRAGQAAVHALKILREHGQLFVAGLQLVQQLLDFGVGRVLGFEANKIVYLLQVSIADAVAELHGLLQHVLVGLLGRRQVQLGELFADLS